MNLFSTLKGGPKRKNALKESSNIFCPGLKREINDDCPKSPHNEMKRAIKHDTHYKRMEEEHSPRYKNEDCILHQIFPHLHHSKESKNQKSSSQ